MNRTEITTFLETLQLDIERMEAADVKASVVALLNRVETLVAENDQLNDPRQSRGLIRVSPSKGPIRNR
jgi:hypothetical protein